MQTKVKNILLPLMLALTLFPLSSKCFVKLTLPLLCFQTSICWGLSVCWKKIIWNTTFVVYFPTGNCTTSRSVPVVNLHPCTCNWRIFSSSARLGRTCAVPISRHLWCLHSALRPTAPHPSSFSTAESLAGNSEVDGRRVDSGALTGTTTSKNLNYCTGWVTVPSSSSVSVGALL